MVSLIREIYSTGKSSFQIISYRTILRLEQLQQRNPDATKEGGREKKKKRKTFRSIFNKRLFFQSIPESD